MPKVLVTGGCGYIGSHTIIDLIDHGYEVVSVDNLLNSDEETLDAVASITGKRVQNYRTDLCDLDATRAIFRDHPDLSGVIHFAALKSVGESVEKPWLYFHNNLNSLLHILKAMEEYAVSNLIFSSSCSVYGNADALPVTEDTPWQPAESPYGRTKQMGEHIIRDVAPAMSGFRSILLRYFNPAGAHESGLIGEAPRNAANNLVPVITEAAIGKRKELVVFGDDYPTRDGSCVRDYIHVMDLAHAHTLALKHLEGGKQKQEVEVYNLGIGEGATVLEVVKAFEAVTEIELPYRIGPRRAGDVVAIYANYDKAKSALGWEPGRSISDIMRTAWAWEKRRSNQQTSAPA